MAPVTPPDPQRAAAEFPADPVHRRALQRLRFAFFGDGAGWLEGDKEEEEEEEGDLSVVEDYLERVQERLERLMRLT